GLSCHVAQRCVGDQIRHHPPLRSSQGDDDSAEAYSRPNCSGTFSNGVCRSKDLSVTRALTSPRFAAERTKRFIGFITAVPEPAWRLVSGRLASRPSSSASAL